MRLAGQITHATDAEQRPFVFALCRPCHERLRRLPPLLRSKQEQLAIRRIWLDTGPFPVRVFSTGDEARVFSYLVAQLPAGEVLAQFEY